MLCYAMLCYSMLCCAMRCYAMLYYAMLYSGLHTCEDVYCVTCGVMVGWEYKWAYEKEQKYKVGNFVLEEVKIMRYHWS
ncbi:unnamed protein product [Ascophyllum nodosum]